MLKAFIGLAFFFNIYNKIILMDNIDEIKKIVRETLLGNKNDYKKDLRGKDQKWDEVKGKTGELLDKLGNVCAEKDPNKESTLSLIKSLEANLKIWKKALYSK